MSEKADQKKVDGAAPAESANATKNTTPTDSANAGRTAAPKKKGGRNVGASHPNAAPRDATGEPWEIVHADFVAAAGLASSLPSHGPEVAFAGRSNVGKSSLINTLTGRKNLVRTGATPGVTRTLTQFVARTRAGISFSLVDLPGYGFAQRSKAEREQWAQLIERYLREREELLVVVLLVDARRGIEEDEVALLEFLAASADGTSGRAPPDVFLVATKLDKLGRSVQQTALATVDASLTKTLVQLGSLAPGDRKRKGAIGWSSVTGQGKSELGRTISLALERKAAGR